MLRRLLKSGALNRYQRTLPQNLGVQYGTQISDFESLTNWSCLGGETIELDATHHTTGSNSIKITGAAGALGRLRNSSLSVAIPASTTFISYDVFVEDGSKLTSIQLYLMNEATDNNYFTVITTGLVTGWNKVTTGLNFFSKTGTITWADTIVRVSIRPQAVAGQVAVCSFDNLCFGIGGTPAILITADDGLASVYSAMYPVGRASNIVGTAYIVSSLIDTGGRMTTAQIIEMNQAGWDIGNHTYDHTDLTTLSDAEVQTELTDCQTFLDGLGLTRASKHVAYPYGFYPTTINDAVLASTIAAGMLTGRSTNFRGIALPMVTPYHIMLDGYALDTATDTWAMIQAWVDGIYASKLPGIVLIHSIGTGANAMTAANYQSLVNYIRSIGIQTLTISELYRLQSGPITVHHR